MNFNPAFSPASSRLAYAGMVRLILTGMAVALLACGVWDVARAQEPPAQSVPQNQYFAGYITALDEGRITVSRTVLGKDSSTRTFLITADTRIDGKPKVRARVTVQYVGAEDGDRAVHIIVRTTTQKKQG